MLTELDNSNISIHLGKSSQYKSTYDPSLLVREPRQSNRTHLNIDDNSLPFVGYDTWNGYEFSCLCQGGTPITGTVKIVYPAYSKYIVESKSIKLYLNSFNMEVFNGAPAEIVIKVQQMIARDLSELLETDVQVCIFLCDPQTIQQTTSQYYQQYTTLEYNIVKPAALVCTEYKENPDLLEGTKIPAPVLARYHSSLLKSNCRVTSQPDWGDVYIHYYGKYRIHEDSLLRYIVSFRDECHFHEEICETIYKRIKDKFEPEELVVTCLYVRRGGIDINPIRANKFDLLDKDLINCRVPYVKTMRQ